MADALLYMITIVAAIAAITMLGIGIGLQFTFIRRTNQQLVDLTSDRADMWGSAGAGLKHLDPAVRCYWVSLSFLLIGAATGSLAVAS